MATKGSDDGLGVKKKSQVFFTNVVDLIFIAFVYGRVGVGRSRMLSAKREAVIECVSMDSGHQTAQDLRVLLSDDVNNET